MGGNRVFLADPEATGISTAVGGIQVPPSSRGRPPRDLDSSDD